MSLDGLANQNINGINISSINISSMPMPTIIWPIYTPKTEFENYPIMLRSPNETFATPVLDKEVAINFIEETLSTIKHLNITSTIRPRKWNFTYGLPSRVLCRQPKGRFTLHQVTLYYAAIAAFSKNTHQFTDEDLIRRDQYRFMVGDLDDSQEHLLPYCSGEISIYYDNYKNNLIIETHKVADDESSGRITTHFIMRMLQDAFKNAGIEVFPFDYSEFKKKIQFPIVRY